MWAWRPSRSQGTAGQEGQCKHLDDEATRGEAERSADGVHQVVVRVPEALQVVGQPPVDLGDVVAELVQLLVERGPAQGEDESLARQEDEDARAEGEDERGKSCDKQEDGWRSSKARPPRSEAASEEAARSTPVRARSSSSTFSCLSSARTALS